MPSTGDLNMFGGFWAQNGVRNGIGVRFLPGIGSPSFCLELDRLGDQACSQMSMTNTYGAVRTFEDLLSIPKGQVSTRLTLGI